MKRIASIILVVWFVVNWQSTNAQETIPINLETLLELGGANSLTIKEYQERQNLANAQLLKARKWWLPDVYAGLQTHQLWGAVMNGNGRFFLDVNRQNLWAGLGLNMHWDLSEGIYATKSAKLRHQASELLTQAERNRELLKMVTAYYNLMTAQLNFVAYQDLMNQSDTIAQQIQVQVDAGLRYQSEVLLAKSNKNHLQVEMLNAQKAYNNASAELKKLLNVEQAVKFVSVDDALLPLDFSETLEQTNDSDYLNRPEIKANELEIQALETKKKTHTTGLLLPELNIGVNGSYFGRISGNVSPMDPIAYPNTDQLYPTGVLNASLLWKIPLGELTYKGDRKKYNSLIGLKTIETSQLRAKINEEIINAQTDLQVGKEQIEIAKEALNLTTEALDQSIERQKLGTAKPFEVFQAQQFFLQAQIDYLKAVSEYNKAQFALKVARGEDF